MSVASHDHTTFNQSSLDQSFPSPMPSEQLPAKRKRRAAHEPFATSMLRALAVFGLGGWFYYELLQLESGEIESVRVWVPIAMLYDTLGFWPAVGLLPAIGCFMVYKAASDLAIGPNTETV